MKNWKTEGQAQSSSCNVLLIESQLDNLVIIKKVLSSLNCQVITARTPDQAFMCNNEQDFACVLADMQIDGQNVSKFARLLYDEDKQLHTPIIFIAPTHKDEHQILNVCELNAVDYLTTPFHPKVLQAKVRNYIDFHQANKQLQGLLDKQKKLLDKLNLLAYYDPLTNLFNRRRFWEMAEKLEKTASRYDEKFALLLLDLDGFKYVNDSLGHDCGDNLLVEVTKRLTETLRDSDLIARMGGDEFAIILPKLASYDDAAVVAQKLNDILAEPFVVNNIELVISASIGIACFPIAGHGIDNLFKKADIALYRAKDKGKDTFYFYSESLRLQYDRNFQLEFELRQAISKEEFFLEYQPCIDLKTSTVVGVEALLRWQSEKYGFVSPEEFIPLAEKSKVINDITLWVTEKACQDYGMWKSKENKDFELAINFSPKLFTGNHDTVDKVIDCINSYGINNCNITFELTESALEGDFEDLDIGLKLLRDQGFNIAIDDFGTGYSSLSRISKFPVSVMKIDKEFVQAISLNQSSEAIINLTISLSNSLGLKVIAEGVESVEQIQFLLANQCYLAQGYYYSKPVAATKISELIKV